MKQLLSGMALLMAISTSAETKQALTLHMESGAEIVYFLDTEPAIGFSGQYMLITAENRTTDIPMSDVDRWEIGVADYSGFENDTMKDTFKIGVYDNELTIHNPESDNIIICNLQGQIVHTGNSKEALFNLPNGVYLIKSENHSYKIAIP